MSNVDEGSVTPILACDNVNYQEEIIDRVKQKTSDPLAVKFLQNFYSYIPVDYIREYDTDFFATVGLSAYEFFKTKEKKDNRNSFIVEITQDESKDHTPFLEIKLLDYDKPFIVDSVKLLLQRAGLEPFFFLYPVIGVKRSESGKLLEISRLSKEQNEDYSVETLVSIRIYGTFKSDFLNNLQQQIEVILEQVTETYRSWNSIKAKLETLIDNLLDNKTEEQKSIVDFLRWIKDDNFTFLSCIKVTLDKDSQQSEKIGHQAYFLSEEVQEITKLACNKYNKDKGILVGKINKSSTIHKNNLINYILVKLPDEKGNYKEAMVFWGLYSSSAHKKSVKEIPILKNKLANILRFSKFSKVSYNAKKFISIVESIPKEVLFEVNEEDLYCSCLNVLSAMNSRSLKLCIFTDHLNLILNIIVFLPRIRLNPDIHSSILNYLNSKFNNKALYEELNDITSDFCNLYISMPTNKKLIGNYDLEEMENELENLSAPWLDSFKLLLAKTYGLFEGLKIFKSNAHLFPKNYIQNFSPKIAVEDLGYVFQSIHQGVRKFKLIPHSFEDYSLKIYSASDKLSLSQLLPLIESLNFNVLDEQTYSMKIDSNKVWIYNLNLSPQSNVENIDLNVLKNNIEVTLDKISSDILEYDPLYKLVFLINADCYQVRCLKAFVHYLQQINFVYSKAYISSVLIQHYKFTDLLLKFFNEKFDPVIQEKRNFQEKEEQLLQYLNNVDSSAEDKVLRMMLQLIQAVLRTNYYQKSPNGDSKTYLSFKFCPKDIPDLPLPIPHAEIFVYGNNFEAVHIRGGKVARGGIRWSDRCEDYRTEVLGLMKAQMTKNTVIVPVGSKGGFFVYKTRDDLDQQTYQNLAVECYKDFLRGMLDITDNIVKGKIVHPNDVVIYDDNDPYLVVAADKGTSTFSDYANAISAEYNFWLSDAFASGGSAGYDHKKIGITSKGAWISVQHHFRSLGLDVQKDVITVVGIGDMSGDVFGNGMLRSRTIKLVAAFNHAHIFIDPNPDTEVSFQERLRLFNLPRSKWCDYNPKLISKGGGVFERSAKIIELSAEAQSLLDLKTTTVSPEELIRSVLKAKVDLIWNGGIGTYIKATEESSFDIGDKSNDVLRCNAVDIRAKVIAEGGNLGVSQRGRIEFEKNGGKINTDFIDNSAGVDCSDHEVNIKIALNAAVLGRRLDLKARNKILDEMTSQVESLVLVDNEKQNQALSIRSRSSLFTIEMFSKMIRDLEHDGFLDRKVEFMPMEAELIRMSKAGEKPRRPEIAILLSYSKMDMYNKLMTTSITDEKFLNKYLLDYFPELMKKDFMKEILAHPLRKEIILTVLTNNIVNQLSGTIFNMIKEETRANLDQMVKAYIIVSEIFAISNLWELTESLASTVELDVQIEIFSEINKLIRRGISWFVKNCNTDLDIVGLIDFYKEPVNLLASTINRLLPGHAKQKMENKCEYYCENNVPGEFAVKVASLDNMISILDMVLVSTCSKRDIMEVAKMYLHVGEILSLDWLRRCCDKLITEDYWNRMSIQSLKDDLYDKQRRLLTSILADRKNYDSFDQWWAVHKVDAERYLELINNIVTQETVDINMIILVNKRFEIFLRKL